MPRRYHSPSSAALGARCAHAWALAYIEGVREPEIPWTEIEAGAACTSRQRATSLGKAVHSTYEAWYEGRTPNWRNLPGQVANSGAHLLPHPTLMRFPPYVETQIGATPLPPDPEARPDAPTVALEVHGVMWAGFKDLVAWPTAAELARLGIIAPDGLVLCDYKSTASIERYALDVAGLRADVQANLYAIDVAEEFGVSVVPARWLYLETKRVRRALPVDVMIHADDAYAILEAPSKLARELDTLTSVADAPKNPLACGDYGGCPHHKSVGGPCDARRSLGGLIQARVKKDPIVALSAEAQAKFDALKKGGAGKAGPAPRTAARPAPASTPDDPPADDAPTEQPAPRQRVSRQRPASAKPATAASAPGAAGAVLELQSQLADACAVLEAAELAVAEIMAKIAEAAQA